MLAGKYTPYISYNVIESAEVTLEDVFVDTSSLRAVIITITIKVKTNPNYSPTK